MQTTKWGPSGWNLLHNVAIRYTGNDPALYREFYSLFKHILPCKYCRESYTVFFDELPIEPYLVSSERLFYWTYLLHNKVNDKLRGQGFITEENPSYAVIKQHYINGCYNGCSYPDYVSFIGCMVFNYGSIGSDRDCPELCVQNAYMRFFKIMAILFPREHNQTITRLDVKSNCALVTWYYAHVIVPIYGHSADNMEMFEKYLKYFAQMRASCSKKTSCRVKL